MARWSRLASPVRVVIDTIHSSSTGTVGRRLGYRWSRWIPDRATAVGEGVRDAYVSERMVKPDRVVVISNGVDTEQWLPDANVRASLRDELGYKDEFLWFAAGRLEPVKDYETMLRAFAQTPEAGRLAIAGSGPLEGELKKLAEELKVADRVRFLGFVSDVRPWMQAADGFVLSSRWEGLPMGLMEAAACGLPAVGTDVAGTREVIADGETGWLAPAGSSKALAEKMCVAMSLAPDERGAMGARARMRVVERYSLDRAMDCWEALYGRLLDENPEARRWARGK
jgi:glycosyltransferase involved in cell wall biosynthesis